MEILKKVWHTWKQIGQWIGDQLARVVLTIFYFTLFVPFALGVRIWGDPLDIRQTRAANWLDRKTNDLTLDDSRRLF